MHGHILLDKNLSIQCPQGLNILIIGQNLSVQCPQGLNILRYKDVESPIHYENGKQALSIILGHSRLTLRK